MPAFACDVCNGIDNTALGHWWTRNTLEFKDASLKGKALCSECAPTTWRDGSPTSWGV